MPGARDGHHHAVAHAQDDAGGVSVAALGEVVVWGSVGGDGDDVGHVVLGEPAGQVEVVDVQVEVDAALAGEAAFRWGLAVVGDQPD
jgi:hypothetical protein